MSKTNDTLIDVPRRLLATVAAMGVRNEAIAVRCGGDPEKIRRALAPDEATNERLIANLARIGKAALRKKRRARN